MFIFAIFSFVFTFCCVVNAQQGPCTQGQQCIAVLKCPAMAALINKPNRSQQDVDTLRKAHCGFEGQMPAVCCPGPDEPVPAPTEQCYTPAGQPGRCISLYSCPELTDLLKVQPVPSYKILYIQNSKCNGPDQYSVCCGPVPDLDNVKRGKCQSSLSAFPPDPRTECCGVDGVVGNKIYGGSPTTVDQYPWLALIEYLDKNGAVKTLCGGALISSKYVLTAAHCVTGQVLTLGTPSAVRLGEYNTTNEGRDWAPTDGGGLDWNEGTTTIPIERTIPHPQYNSGNAQNRNDIALIRMTRLADFTDFIRPICLPTVDMTQRADPFNLTAAGWGAVSTRQSSSAIKLHVELPYVAINQCQGSYQAPGRRATLWRGQLCAGGVKGKDSCKGDSGGPLMYENGKTYEVIGVVSFGPTPCGLENIPGVYTNVYEYSTWIRSHITP